MNATRKRLGHQPTSVLAQLQLFITLTLVFGLAQCVVYVATTEKGLKNDDNKGIKKMQTESAAQNKHRKEEVVAHRFVIYSPSTQNIR